MSLGILENLKKAEQQGIIQPLNWEGSVLLPGEKIRDIVGYENLYQITSFGRVWSIKSQKWLKPYKNSYPSFRLQVKLRKNGYGKDEPIHRLILISFNRLPKNFEEARHLDGNYFNNNLNNLEWSTHAVNMKDNVKHGKTLAGIKNHFAELTEEEVIRIRELYNSRRYTQARLASIFNVHQSQISRIINNRTWKSLSA